MKWISTNEFDIFDKDNDKEYDVTCAVTWYSEDGVGKRDEVVSVHIEEIIDKESMNEVSPQELSGKLLDRIYDEAPNYCNEPDDFDEDLFRDDGKR